MGVVLWFVLRDLVELEEEENEELELEEVIYTPLPSLVRRIISEC